MVLRKITLDNSVRYLPKPEQTKEIKQNTIKNKKQSEQIQPFQEEVNQTRENKTNLFQEVVKKS